MTKIRVEGRWTCPSCEKENLGRDQQCACGYVRDEHTVFKNSGPQEAVDPGLHAKTFSQGEDRRCPNCGGLVQGDATECPGCGNTEFDLAYSQLREIEDAKHETDRARLADSVGSQRVSRSSEISATPFTLIGVAAALVICLTVGVWYFFFNTTSHVVQLTSVAWERSVEIERYEEVQHDGWLSKMPDGAKLIRKYSKHHHYDEVPDGTEWVEKTVGYRDVPGSNCGEEDMGDGSFEVTLCTEPVQKLVEVEKTRSVSVTAMYAEWTEWEWVFNRTEYARGTDQKPSDPIVLLGKRERLRNGSESESYQTKFTAIDIPSITTTDRLSLPVWRALDLGACYAADVNSLGYIIRVDTARTTSC